MDSLGLPTPRAIDDCSPKQPTIFYLLLTRRTICDTPSTVAETREAPSMLRVNNDMRTRSTAGRSTIGITTSQLGVRPPEPSQRWPRLAVLPGDGRGTTTTTPLPGADTIPDDRKTRVECLPLLHALGPFNGPLKRPNPLGLKCDTITSSRRLVNTFIQQMISDLLKRDKPIKVAINFKSWSTTRDISSEWG
jgi:hypothetical protein